MNKAALEVLHIGGEALMNAVRKEFEAEFNIIARTQEYIVLGNAIKNVSFCREKNKIIGRYVFERSRQLERKR